MSTNRRTFFAAATALLASGVAAAEDEVKKAPSLDKDDLTALRNNLRATLEIIEKLQRRFDEHDEDSVLFDNIPDIIQQLERLRQKALTMRSINEPDGHVDWSTMINLGS